MSGALIAQERYLRQSQPLIILGMHRSGTSLAVRLLTEIGVHMGDRLSRDAEAIFFQKLNRRIFQDVDTKWGYVEPLIEEMRSSHFIDMQTSAMQRALFEEKRLFGKEPKISEFFGPQLWRQISKGQMLTWGWKDPRTTLTFPIWLKIFPRAKILHILRNGIDVAISTHRRSLRQQKNIIKRAFPMDYIPITLDFEYCFQLWEQYVSFVFEHKALIADDHYLEIRYEDLLQDPESKLRLISEFMAYPVQDASLSKSSMQVNRARIDNSAYARAYRDQIPPLTSTPLMQQLGYSYTLGN
ncbi:sulfotransferase [Chloroflexota bacterium]